jgi:hypothetical protein
MAQGRIASTSSQRSSVVPLTVAFNPRAARKYRLTSAYTRRWFGHFTVVGQLGGDPCRFR